jgi:Sigma-70, region 4
MAGARQEHGVPVQGGQNGDGNRQWNYFAPVTRNLYTGASGRLPDPSVGWAQMARDLDLARFTGRDRLVRKIDEFIGAQPRGYVIIRAEAGVGKSALAAHLAETRSWPYHFTQLPGGLLPKLAVMKLAAQLIARWDLDDRAPRGVLRDDPGRDSWFAELLTAAAGEARSRRPSEAVVLVVDGIDEAGADVTAGVGSGLPLGLPASLPDGVFVVATSRLGGDRPLHAVRNPAVWLEIEVEGADNLGDMRRFIDRVTSPDDGDGRLVEAIRAGGADLAWFRREVAAACGGVWIYLRYVLNEIRERARDPHSVGDLPADLAAYYAEHVEQWRGLPDDAAALRRWEQTRLPLLGVLAAAHAPLTVTELAALARIPAGESAHGFIEETARAFLSRDDDPAGPPRYALRHESLRDLLTGNVPPGRPDLASLARMFTAQARGWVDATFGLLARLPADQAEVIMLRVFAGLGTETVAEMLGQPAAAVQATARRGLQALETMLSIPGNGTSPG